MSIADAPGLFQIEVKRVHLQEWGKPQNHFAARGGPLFGKLLKGMRMTQIGRERT